MGGCVWTLRADMRVQQNLMNCVCVCVCVCVRVPQCDFVRARMCVHAGVRFCVCVHARMRVRESLRKSVCLRACECARVCVRPWPHLCLVVEQWIIGVGDGGQIERARASTVHREASEIRSVDVMVDVRR